MVGTSRTPVVFAGLLGATVGSIPSSAFASSVAEANIASASLDFLVGVAVGAASCGAVTAVVSASENRKARRMSHSTEDVDDTAVGLQDVAEQGTYRVDTLEDPEQRVSFDQQVPVDEAEVVDNLQAEHEATDYEDIADNYVHRLTWKERMGSRARGVKELLEERMSKDMFSDLPVIERADGSVGDIGTGWWSATLGESIRQDDSIAPDAGADDIDMTGEHGPLDVFEPSISAAVASATASEVASPDAELNMQRGSYIAQRIAKVEQEGSFSEKSDSAAPDQDELWELSMAHMDAHCEEVISAEAAEEVAMKKASESPTAVLPFRPPAGHPEVVDTDTYVDYLIRQEFERSSSQAARTKSRDYLRVMEGGSQSEPTVFAIRDKHESHHAKHMAPMRQVPEHLWANEA